MLTVAGWTKEWPCGLKGEGKTDQTAGSKQRRKIPEL